MAELYQGAHVVDPQNNIDDVMDILVKGGKVVEVEPKVIVEIHYEEIQKSKNYASGYALRFPRIVRLRDDKDLEEISDLREIEGLYQKQRNRGN